MKIKTAAVIPARYGSTRFPGKVLAELCGKPMIQWVYEKAAASIADEVIIATDDPKVAKAVEGFGGRAVMTSPNHPSGTDRISEAVQGLDCGIIINVQGDEPLIPTSVIDGLIRKMQEDASIEMSTVAVPRLRSEIENDPNKVKVVFDERNFALYFSRSIVPYLREGGKDAKTYLHWGIYGYRRDILKKLVRLAPSPLEQCEKLEQLRALEHGIPISVVLTSHRGVGVDTPADAVRVEKLLRA